MILFSDIISQSGGTAIEIHMREFHPELTNLDQYVTLTPFKIYENHSKNQLIAHEGHWINYFDMIAHGLNRRQEKGKIFDSTKSINLEWKNSVSYLSIFFRNVRMQRI